ncbi:hypothetical protein [uncultured Ruegeria sp.]|uniref:hypothetical protein n=1 Tax=uncultured Ruegeria sp. TaxID=259304 RepID=UPI00260FDDEC|nr:hypothetical protein [uncultured Ruegeria sp.]
MKDQDFTNAPDLGEALEKASKRSGLRTVEIDVERYQAYLDDPALSDAQREDIIQALWTIIVAFVELGFGVHPVQQACGQPEKELDPADKPDSDVVKSSDTALKGAFNKAPERE